MVSIAGTCKKKQRPSQRGNFLNEKLTLIVRKLADTLRQREDSIVDYEHTVAQKEGELEHCERRITELVEEKAELEKQMEDILELNEVG